MIDFATRFADTKKVFIIAEMSGNHNQDLQRALEIVDAAAEAGVDALKIQTYTADTMTINSDDPHFVINDAKSLWHGKSLYKLYQEAHTPWEWHADIFARCRERGVFGFSTPFDETSVDFLETLNVPFYKVASFENTDHQLIRKIAGTGKPMIMSTGMASLAELEDMVRTAREGGCTDLTLLKCTSSYPADPSHSNLLTIPHMRDMLGTKVGLSDHTLGIGAAVAAAVLGATVIEKHFTMCRADGGVDAAFSLEPQEMKALVDEVRRASAALGKVSYGFTSAEQRSLQFRRSLFVVKDVRSGDPLTVENVRSIRPGFGLATKHLGAVLARKAKTDIKRGTPLSWDILE